MVPPAGSVPLAMGLPAVMTIPNQKKSDHADSDS